MPAIRKGADNANWSTAGAIEDTEDIRSLLLASRRLEVGRRDKEKLDADALRAKLGGARSLDDPSDEVGLPLKGHEHSKHPKGGGKNAKSAGGGKAK